MTTNDNWTTDRKPVETRKDTAMEALADSTVMLVDDDAFTLEVIGEFLGEAGYRNIVPISDPREAMEKIQRMRPDVVMLDLMMPEVSGFDILRQMRADPDLRYLPVIMLTAAGDAETKLEALELGAADFLAKPVDPSELTLRLRNTLGFKAYRNRLENYDGLTGLPNRLHFINRLGGELRQRRPDAGKLAVLHIDLDRFKQINDTLGHSVGDALIKAVANRFRNVLKRTDRLLGTDLREQIVLARFGGDEFTLMVPEMADMAVADHLASRMLNSLSEPFQMGKHEFFITASIGIALSPDNGDDVVNLLKHAEIAMHAAKSHGRHTYKFFSPELNALSAERLTLETDLRLAVERKELVLHYQPQVEIATGRIFGVEALMRWQHPKLGLVMPGRFIPVAEEAGLIHELGEWALHEACRQAKEWEIAGHGGMTVSVNVATQQFRRAGFADTVRDALAESGLAPERLMLEMTESMLMTQVEQGIALLNEIKGTGVRLSIDDFGTGYSSFSYLKTLPLDELKIDRSFVIDMDRSPKSAAIVDAIVTLAHGLGLKVVVEGVETAGQLARLTASACRHYQGYLFSEPLPADQLLEKLANSPLDSGFSTLCRK